jgi:hypothetical protein
MMEQIAEVSPRPRARLTGVVYLLYFLTAPAAQLFTHRPALYIAINLIAFAFYIAVTLLFYYLFKAVNRILSLLAALLSLAGCADAILGLFNRAPHKIDPLMFFGPFCILIGYLIFKSTFLPKTLGVLMALAGVGWLIFLSPRASRLSTFIEVFGFIAEASLMLWLVVKGVNVERWEEQAGAAGASIRA